MAANGSRSLESLLADHRAGVPGAFEQLSEAVYEALRQMARRRMEKRFPVGLPGVTFCPTEIAHETFMRLIKQRKAYANGDQFFAIAATQMGRVLANYYGHRKPAKRPLPADIEAAPDGQGAVDIEAVNRAMQRLREFDSDKADVVLCRHFCELTIDETVESLGIPHATVERHWKFSLAWLADELAGKHDS